MYAFYQNSSGNILSNLHFATDSDLDSASLLLACILTATPMHALTTGKKLHDRLSSRSFHLGEPSLEILH